MPTKKRRIMHLITSLDVGGAENMLFQTLKSLKPEFENYVICLMNPGDFGTKIEQLGIKVQYMGLSGITDIGKLLKLCTVVRSFNPEILVTYLIHSDLIGRVVGRVCGVKTIICSVRALFREKKYYPLVFIERISSFMVSNYLFNSHFVADYYQKYLHLSPEKITIITNSVDTNRFSPVKNKTRPPIKLQLPSDVAIIGYIGRFRKQKSLDTLITAISLCRAKCYLLLVGGGPEEEALRQLVSRLNLGSKVLLLPKQSGVEDIYRTIDIFVLPSLYEGMSNSLLEAMSSGNAVIASDIGENRELVTHDVNGLLVTPRNSILLAKAIDLLASNIHLRKKYSEFNRKLILEKYDTKQIGEKFKKYYSEV